MPPHLILYQASLLMICFNVTNIATDYLNVHLNLCDREMPASLGRKASLERSEQRYDDVLVKVDDSSYY